MNEKAEALKARTKLFALDVLSQVRSLPPHDASKAIGRQLLRSGTSVAANYRAACRARSRAEFVAKIGIALEEADESVFWLEVLIEGRIADTPKTRELLDEANQLAAILAASRITTLTNLKSSI